MTRTFTRLAVSACALFALTTTAVAKTINVAPDAAGTPVADAVAQLEDGDKLVFAAGTYSERLTLVDHSKIKVIGKGEVVFDNVGPSATISITNCTKIKLQGIQIINAPTQGLLIMGCDSVSVKKVVVTDQLTQGIQAHDSTRVSIQKCDLTGGINGVYVTGASSVNVSGNTVSGTSNESIFVLQVTLPGNVIRQNTVSDSGNAGIVLDGPGNKAERNTVTDCLLGIVTPFGGGDMSDSRIQKNTVTGGAVALRTYAQGTLLIAKNTVDGASGSGLQIAKLAGGSTITRNKFMNTASGIDDESDIAVTVSKNKVSNTTSYGIRARGTDGSTFEKNVVNDTPGDGFAIWTAGNTFTKNKATGNAGFDLESARVAEGDSTFNGNKFGTTTFDP